jgi:hypothetical protein
MELLEQYKADTNYREALRHDDDQAFDDRMSLPKLKGNAIHFDAAEAFCKHEEPDCFPFPTQPAIDMSMHMGMRAYYEDGPYTEVSTMRHFNCEEWSKRLDRVTLFQDPELQSKCGRKSREFRAKFH